MIGVEKFSRNRTPFGTGHMVLSTRRGPSTLAAATVLCALSSLIVMWISPSPRGHSRGKSAANPLTPVSTHQVEMNANTSQTSKQSKYQTYKETVASGQPYVPTYRKWKELVFDFAWSATDVDDGGCIGWMQTGRCRADGPPEPFFSKPCDAGISGPSGYCLCTGKKAGGVSCDESQMKHFTCRSVCLRGR